MILFWVHPLLKAPLDAPNPSLDEHVSRLQFAKCRNLPWFSVERRAGHALRGRGFSSGPSQPAPSASIQSIIVRVNNYSGYTKQPIDR